MSVEPLLRIVRGAPDDAELAALTAVIAGLTSASESRTTGQNAWRDRVRTCLCPPTGDAWRVAGLPR